MITEKQMNRMNKDIYFMPLGGGQSVGASCYYLRLGQHSIILDAGVGGDGSAIYGPNLYSLLTTPFIYSYGQIDQIYISHAHMDHVGYLCELMEKATRASVYMTNETAILAEYQLYDRRYIGISEIQKEKSMAAKSIFDRLTRVSYMNPMDFGKYKVNFFEAGHIPGAMMTLFEFANKKILYTGDYSLCRTALTDGCVIPKGLDIDILIICALHAKHPNHMKKSDYLRRSVLKALDTVTFYKKNVLCRVSQLSKGVELLKMINEKNTGEIPIYIDRNILNTLTKMESFSGQIMTEQNKIMTGSIPNVPHILITADKRFPRGIYEEISSDFSLHENFEDLQTFIRTINPKTAVLVHCAGEQSSSDQTMEQLLMIDGDCRTQFIFAEDNQLYKL